jgi:hypothetical protein
VARFRRQDSNPSGANIIQRTQSDQMVDNTSQNPLRQTQSQDNLMISPADEIKSSVIMNKRIEVNQSMSSGGFPLLTQQPKQNELPTTPDKNQVNRNDYLIYFYFSYLENIGGTYFTDDIKSFAFEFK